MKRNAISIPALIPLIIVIITSIAESAPPLLLTDDRGSFPLENRLDVIANEDKTLTIEDVSTGRARHLFSPAKGRKPRFDYSHTVVWARFTVENRTSRESEFILELDCPPIDKAILFIPHTGRDFESIMMGDLIPFGERPLGNRKPLFPIRMEPGASKTYFMKLESLGTIQAFLTVWKPNDFYITDHHQQIVFGLYFGILIALALYNLFIFFSVWDITYLAYVTYIFGFGIWASWNLGFINEYILGSFPRLANISGPFFLFLSLAGIMLFVALFLRTPVTMPFMNIVIKGQVAVCALGLIGCMVLHYNFMIRVMTIMGFTVPVTSLICGIIAVMRNIKEARFLLAAWITLIVASVVFILKDMGALPYTFVTKHAIFFGSALEVILFSFALGDRITIMRRDKEEAQEKTIALQREHAESLEIKVTERTKELRDAYARLQDLDRVKSNFFAAISHEFRTPLTLILSPVESALDDGMGSDADRTMLESIRNNSLKLLSLINDLLDLSKLDAGMIKLRVGCFDAASAVRAHADAIDAACRVKNIALEVSTPEGPVHVWGDPKRIGQVIDNLLSNAMKFTGPGGKVFIEVSETDHECSISVKDTGAGIPHEYLGVIFDRFIQADQSTTRFHEGTGIGLAIAREFTELHGGTITVTSKHAAANPADHGSIFTVTVPLGRDHFEGRNDVEFGYEANTIEQDSATATCVAGDAAAPESAVLTAGDKPYSILVVEDNRDMHELLAGILGNNYEVLRAMNGSKALEMLGTLPEPPDLVLADVMMPGMSGTDFTARLRADERFTDIPVIMLTARADTDMKIEGFASGANDYITKPFNARELMARVSNQLSMKSMRDRLARANDELYARLLEKSGKSLKVSATTEEKVRHITEFIHDNYTSDLTRDGLAAAVGMSPDHLSRAFNRLHGKKIPEYINEIRVREAARRLEKSTDSILHIAFAVGFDNLRTFNRAFLKIMKMTPRDFRSGRN
jgi:signal transduction histidine kinase/DNA-binding response OmpR family regulator